MATLKANIKILDAPHLPTDRFKVFVITTKNRNDEILCISHAVFWQGAKFNEDKGRFLGKFSYDQIKKGIGLIPLSSLAVALPIMSDSFFLPSDSLIIMGRPTLKKRAIERERLDPTTTVTFHLNRFIREFYSFYIDSIFDTDVVIGGLRNFYYANSPYFLEDESIPTGFSYTRDYFYKRCKRIPF